MKNYKLTIELVPSTSWFNNIRAMVSSRDWDIIKTMTFKQASYRCEICGGKGHKWPVECHEVWEYDDVNNTQTLNRTIALCPTCHQVKHMGLQFVKFPTRIPRLVSHMAKVNNCTKAEMEDYIEECFRVHSERSKSKWAVDVSWIKKRFPNMAFKEK